MSGPGGSQQTFLKGFIEIERNEIRSVVGKKYALRDVVNAQEDFMAKRFSGKLAIEVANQNL